MGAPGNELRLEMVAEIGRLRRAGELTSLGGALDMLLLLGSPAELEFSRSLLDVLQLGCAQCPDSEVLLSTACRSLGQMIVRKRALEERKSHVGSD